MMAAFSLLIKLISTYNMSNNNSKRALEGLFTISAWHAKFNGDNKHVDLFVHVNFDVAKLGQESETTVSFELRLRRATIVAKLPESGYEVALSSVARTKPVQLAAESTSSKRTTVAGDAGASIQNHSLKASASAKLSQENTISETINISENLNTIRVKDGQTADGHYCWHLEPSEDIVLSGTPWDVLSEPRFKIRDLRDSVTRDSEIKNNFSDPTEVELHCRREDLDISLKINETLLDKCLEFGGKGKHDKRLAAAESYIRDELVRLGFISQDSSIKGDYVKLQLASIFAKEEE